MRTSQKSRLLLSLLLFSGITSFSQDRLFTYTYQSGVLNKGQREIEIWNTLRAGKGDYFLRLDHRTEFEIGLGKNLQTAFYLNLTTKTGTNADQAIHALETKNEIGFSNEWKLKILDPVANPVGLALYGEYGISSNELEFEGKVIVDKKINNFTIAANGVYEMELAPEIVSNETVWEKEKKADLNLAFAYSFNSKFHLTQENSFNNVFADNKLEHSALYSGIGFSYNQENFWINFTAMPQITSFKGTTSGRLDLNEFEKAQFRLLFSYAF